MNSKIDTNDIYNQALDCLYKIRRIVSNLDALKEHISRIDLSPIEKRDLRSFYKRIRGSFSVGRFDYYKYSTHILHEITESILKEMVSESSGHKESKVLFSLKAFGDQLIPLKLSLRDVVNEMYFKLRKISTKNGNVQEASLWDGEDASSNLQRFSHVGIIKHFNSSANNLEVLQQKTTLCSYPVRLTVEATNACNYRCTMCPHGYYETMPSFYEIKDEIIDKLQPAILVSGYLATQVSGEPSLSRKFQRIVDIASYHYTVIEMITNGSLLDKIPDAIGKISNIITSFDGATKEIFENLRIGSSFERVKKNIASLRSSCPLATLEFNVCVSKKTLSNCLILFR